MVDDRALACMRALHPVSDNSTEVMTAVRESADTWFPFENEYNGRED